MSKFHRIIECAGLEGTHQVQLLTLPSSIPKNPTLYLRLSSKCFLNSAGLRTVTTPLEEFAILHPSRKWHKHHRNVGLHTSFHLAWNHKKPWKRSLTLTFLMVKEV